MVVDEDVAMAAMRPSAERRAGGSAEGREASAGRARPGPVRGRRRSRRDRRRDRGRAAVWERLLTFTEFDVDPGVDVDVFLSADPGGIDDAVELGDLKGNVGDQQYPCPARRPARHSNVILWCNPFTVRIAVAELGV